MAVPPFARSPAIACLAAARDAAFAIVIVPLEGKTGQAVLVPATTANRTPSRTTSTAAAVAARASAIFVCGYSIDPEQSMMMISAAPSGPSAADAAPAGPAPVSPAASAADATVTIALASRPPSGRYWFWSTSMVNPDSGMTESLLG